MLNRRDLLRQAALSTLVSASGLVHGIGHAHPSASGRAIDALQLEPFVDPLTLLQRLPLQDRRIRITMREIRVQMHRDLPPTRLWSYGPEAIGPLLEARSHEELVVEWYNQLPPRHFLPIDYSLHGSGRDLPDSRSVVHLHGGRTPAVDDGYPEHWYPPGQSHVCHYPNRQDAAMLWYHDHAMGTSRLNLYAGLMGVYLLRDAHEKQLNLPSGNFELPLVLYDRIFDDQGQLFYPVSPDPQHPWMDEVAGDAMIVNGRVQPFYEVEPRCYRLRVLNAANARFFRLGLSNGASFQQIGADQGLLPAPVRLAALLLAPGERADLIVDFAPMRGERIQLTNGAFQMMQFRVASAPTRDSSHVPGTLLPRAPLPPSGAARTREMTLNEFKDPAGNPVIMLLNRTPWHMPVTETAKLGSTEIWSFVNLTDDTHPIHLHHVRFQVIDRRPFDRDVYLLDNTAMSFTGSPLAPNPDETGWKDVVQCPPNMVTRIHISFDGYPGRYLWHCHVQEHEANDMMRPLRHREVGANASVKAIMKRSVRVSSRHFVLITGFLVLSVGCRTPGHDKPIGEVVAIKAPLGLPPVPIPADNPPTVETIALGRNLFYDPRLSKNNTVSCASCHNPNFGFTDGLAIARGIGGLMGKRNAPTLLNAAYSPFQFWDGRASTLETQSAFPIADPVEMNQDHDVFVGKIRHDPRYKAEFAQAFGPGTITLGLIEKSLASFERTLLSGNSPFDQYQYGGTKQALPPAAIRGLAIFKDPNRGNCAVCHTINDHYALFTDGKFHNTGAGVNGEGDFTDLGRFGQTKIQADKGEFKTPTLRNVALSAPYMHDGSLKTLNDVVDFYAGGGNSNPFLDKDIKSLRLSAQDRADLVAFLESLTGQMPKNAGPPGKE